MASHHTIIDISRANLYAHLTCSCSVPAHCVYLIIAHRQLCLGGGQKWCKRDDTCTMREQCLSCSTVYNTPQKGRGQWQQLATFADQLLQRRKLVSNKHIIKVHLLHDGQIALAQWTNHLLQYIDIHTHTHTHLSANTNPMHHFTLFFHAKSAQIGDSLVYSP